MLVTVLDMLVTVLLVVSVGVFGWCCWGRDWLLYPNYNYLSWGWGTAVLSAILHALTSLLDLRELGRHSILKTKSLAWLHEVLFSSDSKQKWTLKQNQVKKIRCYWDLELLSIVSLL